MNVLLLKGVVGSTAYGLAHEGSDVDHLGVFAASNETVLGLGKQKESIQTHDPDVTMHEVRKFAALCLNGNPTVSELLWLDKYEHMTDAGSDLIKIRQSFLSSRQVRDSYLGYADSQFRCLLNRADGSFSADTRKRTQKHARHMVRLVEQGFRLYTTGELVINLRSSHSIIDADWVVRMGKEIEADPEVARRYMERAGERFDRAESVLPEKADRETVEDWLISVRRANWGLT